MLSDEEKKKWKRAYESEEWHTYDPTGNFVELRIHDDVPSMLGTSIAWEAEEMLGADAVFVGIPFEGFIGSGNGNSWASCGPREVDVNSIVARSGAWQSPDYIRKCSPAYALHGSGGFYPEVGPDFRLLDHLTIMDYGNVKIDSPDSEEMARRSIEKIGDIVKAGAVPLVFGGDHSIPFPVVKAISDNSEGKTGLMWFDSHYDIGYGERFPPPHNTISRLNAENAMYRILESSNVDPRNVCIVGIGSGNFNTPAMAKFATEELGITIFTSEDVDRQGIGEIMAKALDVTTRGTERTYVTLDIDSVDGMTFPAQKYLEPLAIPFRDIIKALRIITRETQIAGLDTCCIGPAYDVNTMGGLCANRLYLEVLKGLALKKANSVSG
jgi:arginase family enzyme